MNSYENEECMICLEPLNNEIAEVSCSHLFHYKCIEKWLNTNKNILRACCVCENNTEIVNIINFDFSVNQNQNTIIHNPINHNTINQNPINRNPINRNPINRNIYENNLNQNNINNRQNLEENNNSFFSCCNIL